MTTPTVPQLTTTDTYGVDRGIKVTFGVTTLTLCP
jgi:hypothetical protein